MYQDLKQRFWWHGMKKGYYLVCDKVPGMSASEGGISENNPTSSTLVDSRVKMGTHHDGFCHCITSQPKGEQCSVGYS